MIVTVRNLRITCVVGVRPDERAGPQPVVLNIEFDYDAQRAAATDDVEDALDYQHIVNMVASDVEKTRFHLLEKLADYVLERLMSDSRVRRATVTIEKPQAMERAESVAVTATAQRH
jgi:FolB domain-containing protein